MAAIRSRLTRLAIIICACPLLAHGDGMKFPPTSVDLYPNIPSQRALITFRDGVESLTIESSYDGEGDSFGWIVPVPATPTVIEEGSSGAISSISAAVQPDVIQRVKGSRVNSPLAVACLVFAVGLGLFLLIFAPTKPRSFAERIALTLLFFVATWLLTFVITGLTSVRKEQTAGAGPAVSLDVEVEMTAVAGDLDVEVLRAGNPEDLNAWLGGNGYKELPEAGRAIVAAYIAEGWRFCAAKERRSGAGVSRTHALRIVFPAPQPVYPMRLTALAGNEVALQLLVVADTAMSAPGMDRQRVRQFTEEVGIWGHPYLKNLGQVELPYMRSEKSRRVPRVGHPEALNAMWDGCVVTNLTGALAPSDMENDILLLKGNREETAATYWTAESAYARAAVPAFTASPIVLILMLLLTYRTGHSRGQRTKAVALSVLVTTISCAALGCGVRWATPVVEIEEETHPYAAQSLAFSLERLQEHEWLYVLQGYHMKRLEEMTLREVVMLVLEESEVEEGDGPQQYELGENEQGIWVRVNDRYGAPKIFNLGHTLPPMQQRP